MRNDIPKGRGLLAGLAIKVLVGLKALGTLLGITQMPPDTFEADLDAFNDGVDDYNAARSAQRTQSETYKQAVKNLHAYLKAARAALVISFGNYWTTMWAQAGFVQPSTAVPRRIADQLALALSLKTFFTNNPSYEVTAKNVTAKQADIVRTAVTDAQNAMQPAKVATRTAQNTMRAAQQVLTAAIRTVIKVLSTALGPNDPRWEQFGLNMPGLNGTPAAPTGLYATPMTAGYLLGCNAQENVTRFRFRYQIVGVDQTYSLIGSAVEPMFMWEDAPAGVTVEIIAQAVNGGSQGKACDPITITTPPASGAPELKFGAALAKAPAASTLAPAPNGKGNGKAAQAASRLS